MDKKARNKEIVSRTHILVTGQLRIILPAALISVAMLGMTLLLPLLTDFIGQWFAGAPQIALWVSDALGELLQIAAYVLIYPAAILGMTRVLLKVWRGRSAPLREYFLFYRDKRHFVLAAKAGLATTLLGRAVSLVTYGAKDLIAGLLQKPQAHPDQAAGTVDYLQNAGVMNGLLTIINLAANVGYIVLSVLVIRFTLTAVVEWADERAFDVIPTMRRSWSLSRGMVLRSIGLAIRAAWLPYLMLCALICIVFVGMVMIGQHISADALYGVVIVLTVAAMVYLLPLARLPVIGMVDELLSENPHTEEEQPQE